MGSKTERAVFHVFTGRRWREERAPLYTRPVQDGLREARLNLLCFVGSQAIWGEGKEPLYQIMTMAWERQDLTCDVLCVHRPGGGAPVQDLYKMGSGTERAILYVCPQAGGGEKKEHLYKILVIGELGTGKTSIIKRYVHQFFSQHYRATVSLNNNNTARDEKDCW